MNGILNSARPDSLHAKSDISPRTCRIEALEARRLLAFSTVDAVAGSFYLGAWESDVPRSHAASDSLGNVYVAGWRPGSFSFIRQGSSGGTSWTNILEIPDRGEDGIGGVAASPGGDVYAGVYSGVATTWNILQRPAGATQFYQVHTELSSGFRALSVDPVGTAYGLTGRTVLRQSGSLGAFTAVDVVGTDHFQWAMAATEHGVYTVGRRTYTSGHGANAISRAHWIVRKSPTGDPGTWSTVDDFQYDAVNNAHSVATEVAVGADGTVHVAGYGEQKVRTGGTNKKPIYTTTRYQLVRTSTDGGASWTTNVVGGANTLIADIDTDADGNVYVAGYVVNSGIYSSMVRTKPAGGTGWTTIDEVTDADAAEFIVDSIGNLYVAGNVYGGNFVRMQSASASVSGGGSTSIFADSRIPDTSDDRLADLD